VPLRDRRQADFRRPLAHAEGDEVPRDVSGEDLVQTTVAHGLDQTRHEVKIIINHSRRFGRGPVVGFNQLTIPGTYDVTSRGF
jgi:hypothetical protein